MEHIRHIHEEGELDESATCRKFRQVRTEGNRQVARELPFYNLDIIISLGYRVQSHITTQFRRWVTERLKEYMLKGFTMADERLKQLSGGNYWKELPDRIRDICSSEKWLSQNSFFRIKMARDSADPVEISCQIYMFSCTTGKFFLI